MEEHRCSISSSLVELVLDGCCKWECLPTLGRFPSLKRLTIKKAQSVKKIGPEFYGEIVSMHGRGINNNKGYSYFPRLEFLYLEEMSLWEEWEMPAAGQIHSSGGGRRHVLFPSLKKLYIDLCPKLLTLSPILRHLTNLEDFRVFGCTKLAFSSAMLCRLTALGCLEIRGCDELILDGGVAEDGQETISRVQRPVVVDNQVEEEHVMNDAERETVDVGQSPSPYLKKSLTVRRAQLPSWMMEHHRLLPSTLVKLVLEGCCTNWEYLPTLGQFPSLEWLTIKKADLVRKIGSEFYGGEADVVGGRVYFPRLEYLYLEEMSVWEEWDVPAAGEMDGGGGGTGRGRHGHVLLFPSLKYLHIYSCPKLPSLSPVLRHLTNLVDIDICGCDELASLEDGCGWVLPSLWRLTIHGCPKLASLTPILRRSTNLERIVIEECDELASLDCPGIECLSDGGLRLPSLRQLWIRGCPLLEGRYREGGRDALNIPTTTRVFI
ncbi:hypothetical protein Taro_028631 [Colocasia esculenta]|uniref:R13L1/DRL21-like LRR repeat region domain-containing protein n=1 Tax=Colocasia esculenta TaxID=4460 RepID=A0A843VSG7_COLES|nr:hypothetical protein [Colocasia esculenta]